MISTSSFHLRHQVKQLFKRKFLLNDWLCIRDRYQRRAALQGDQSRAQGKLFCSGKFYTNIQVIHVFLVKIFNLMYSYVLVAFFWNDLNKVWVLERRKIVEFFQIMHFVSKHRINLYAFRAPCPFRSCLEVRSGQKYFWCVIVRAI